MVNNYVGGVRVYGEVWPRIIDYLSMLYFGFLEQERLGEICRQIMESGKMFISVLADGEIKVLGKGYWALLI